MAGRWWRLVASLLLASCDDGADEQEPDGTVPDSATVDAGEVEASPDAQGLDAVVMNDADTTPLDATSDGAVDPALEDGAAPVDASGQFDASEALDACAGCAPTAAFQLSATTGGAPLAAMAISDARPGAAPIVETIYDWGEGDGPTNVAFHRYGKPGSYTVRQRVRDASGKSAEASAVVTVMPSSFVPATFSSTDRSPCIAVSPSGFEVELTNWGPCGVRSDVSIAPQSGVFYFEVERLTPQWRGGGIGVATREASLMEQVGASAQSMGVLAWGPVRSAGGVCTGSDVSSSAHHLGFVVDYRAATPVIHVLQANEGAAPTLRASCTMAVSAPLHLFYSGDRSRVGHELQLNSGADTTNAPFLFSATDVRAALTAQGDPAAASALVMGFGATRAGPLDTPPSLTVPPDLSVPLGQSVTLEGQAVDAEDGPIHGHISWRDLAAQHHAPVTGKGKTFTFTPTTLGIHPVVAQVEDADGVASEKTVRVKVTGTLPQANPVVLTPDALTGPGITVSPDGLSVSFNGTGKDGIRANQGLYGRFWYFEVHRDSPIRNMGMGLVIANGALNPYDPPNVPWSCSLNVMRGFWVNLIEAGDWTKSPLDIDYGFAVDYRGDHPIVYIIIRGELQGRLVLDQVWEPLYPMVYGNPPDAPVPFPDMTLNFGTKPFAQDPRTILSAAGVDVSALELGWGLSPAISQ
jgi:PKD repeat protein